MLLIADDLKLPTEVATESIAILGRRGSGKSNAAVVLAEEMFREGIPWVAIDPKGDWYGIRSSVDGKSPGLPIPVFGGLHGDVPIEPTAGPLVADLLVDENLTAVLDVSDFTKADRRRFLTGFFDRLYQRHRKAPQARHVFMEEAHEFIPQQVPGGDESLKEAASRIVLQGRSFGLGSSVCSQRSAKIHKDVLTQTSILIAMWTTGPHDRKAIEAWVHEHDAGKELVASLPGLKPGEGWVWATPFDLMQRTRFRMRSTFDSGSTPVLGKSRKVATIADVDTQAITERMAETIERAKADDPKELRARIQKLERELAKPPAEVQVETKVLEVEVVPEQLERGLIDILDAFQAVRPLLAHIDKAIDDALKVVDQARDDVKLVNRTAKAGTPQRTTERTLAGTIQAPQSAKPQVKAHAPSDTPGDTKLSKAERAILTVLAQYPQGRTKTQIALLAGYASTGGSFNNSLSKLRTAGRITGGNKEIMSITTQGIDDLGYYDPLPTGKELREWWAWQLPKAEKLIFEYLCEIYPEADDKEGIAAATGYEPTGGSFGNSLSRLRTRELITGYGEMQASDHLFK